MTRPSFMLTLASLVVWTTAFGALEGSAIQETADEFLAGADLNGDGVQDIVLVDKTSGRVRLGYCARGEPVKWTDWRESGARGITGLTVGRFFRSTHDGLAFAARDDNAVTLLDASSAAAASAPVEVPFMLLGPAGVATVEVPGHGDASLQDLLVTSVYNTPDENMASVYRNTGGNMEFLREFPLAGVPVQCGGIQPADDQPGLLALMLQEEAKRSLLVQLLAGEASTTVAELSDLAEGARYAPWTAEGGELRALLLWTPGGSTVDVHPLLQPAPGIYRLASPIPQNLSGPIQHLVALSINGRDHLFVIRGQGEHADLYGLDGFNPPVPIQTVQAPTNHVITGALPVGDGFMVFQAFASGGASVRYQLFQQGTGDFRAGVYGRLPSLADNDRSTVPQIHARITEQQGPLTEADMRAYTNTIPGSDVEYVMVPIPGGEFLMGSPEEETGHRPDEAPQHQVRVAPFWMGRCEVTWNEFELFMYPDEERKRRATHPSDELGDALADAVTHPSKPYADMTFGMGRQGYPAIAMTQHAANKYCQWLSAKTGEFHRLPTEAEWEYAARAGTSTAYFFGDDPASLDDYAWYEMNSDFKYQKVGRKKPNPWGLHDIYGNVVEWVLDQYDPAAYAAGMTPGLAENPWVKATAPYPHSVRGGSWDDPAQACRSAARRGSDPRWKLQDPQLPKSTWYFTDADFVGFRIVRPLKTPGPEAMQAYWNSGVERE